MTIFVSIIYVRQAEVLLLLLLCLQFFIYVLKYFLQEPDGPDFKFPIQDGADNEVVIDTVTFAEEYETTTKQLFKEVLQSVFNNTTILEETTTQQLEATTDFSTADSQFSTTLQNIETHSNCNSTIIVTNCSMDNNARWFITANSHHSAYLFFGVMLGVFLFIVLVIVILYLKHKRQVFRSRYGEYKLTTIRSINSQNSNSQVQENAENHEAVSKH